eukprot:scaffold51584_cov69-Phaeocystis_antarctica.AAC.1
MPPLRPKKPRNFDFVPEIHGVVPAAATVSAQPTITSCAFTCRTVSCCREPHGQPRADGEEEAEDEGAERRCSFAGSARQLGGQPGGSWRRR